MTLTENSIRDAVRVDFGSEVTYGSDQMNDCYPVRFATVEFMLTATDILVEIADRIRMEKGCMPMYPRDGSTGCDEEGFYNFYVGISSLPTDNQKCWVDNCISFVVVNSDSEDNESMYEIDLTESEREVMYLELDRQCRCHLGKSCEELLAEANAEMEKNSGEPPDLFKYRQD